MLRPIEKIGLYILFAMMVVMFLVFLTEVVWGHETLGTREIDFGPPEQHRPPKHCHAEDLPSDVLADPIFAELAEGCDHPHYFIDGRKQVLCYDLKPEKPEVEVDSEPTPTVSTDSTSVSTPTPTTRQRIPVPIVTTSPEQIPEILDEVVAQEPVIPDEVKEIVEDAPEPEVEDLREWQTYQFVEGWNLTMFSVVPEAVTTLAELYPHLIPDTVLVVNIAGCWLKFAGEGETGKIKLHPNIGIAVYSPIPFTLGLFGHRIKLRTSFPIHAGLNLIGFSQPPPELERPSDLLSETGIIVTLRAIDGVFYLVGRVGDEGDVELRPNEAFMAVSLVDYDLGWDTPAAPMAYRQQTLATSWGAMKR